MRRLAMAKVSSAVCGVDAFRASPLVLHLHSGVSEIVVANFCDKTSHVAVSAAIRAMRRGISVLPELDAEAEGETLMGQGKSPKVTPAVSALEQKETSGAESLVARYILGVT